LDKAPSTSTYQSGDKVTVSVQLASKENVLWLPPDAIRSAGGRFVIINGDSGPQRVDVESTRTATSWNRSALRKVRLFQTIA
jgi:hypothetical protein